MSTHRTRQDSGWVDPKDLPKGPSGRALCRFCNQEVGKGRRSFCSPECVHEWKIQTNPEYLRDAVFKRDHGVCAVCATDTQELRRRLQHRWREIQSIKGFREREQEREQFNRTYPYFGTRRSYWDADHIVPVVEGGGECDLQNIQTLCIPCHQKKTAELAALRAEKRRSERELALGKVRLPL